MATEITLLPHQYEAYRDMLSILAERSGVLNTGSTGTGKTPFSLKYCQEYKLYPLIICTKSNVVTWKNETDKYGIEADILTYGQLKGKRLYDLKHEWLTRQDYETKTGIKKTKFHTTFFSETKMLEGLVLIVDEVQNIKNHTTGQSKAVSALIDKIKSINTHSRFMLLSASPFDQPKHAIHFARMFGFIQNHKLYEKKNQDLVLLGLQEIIDGCELLDKKSTNDIWDGSEAKAYIENFHRITKKLASDVIAKFYSQIIIKHISVTMDLPQTDIKHFKYNGFFQFEDKKAEWRYSRAVKNMENEARYDPFRETVNVDQENVFWIFKALQILEKSKLPLFKRVALMYLMSNKKCKFIIALNYLDSINELSEELAYFEPLVLTGSSSTKQRFEIVKGFNTNPKRRLLIGSINVMKEGLNLDDTNGNFPRIAIRSPNFSIITRIQFPGRFNRSRTKSSSTCIDLYGMTDKKTREIKLTKLLAEKLSVVNSSIYNRQTGQYKMDDVFEELVEEDLLHKYSDLKSRMKDLTNLEELRDTQKVVCNDVLNVIRDFL